MANSMRKITRSGFAEKLGLHGPDLSPRYGTWIGDTVMKFYSLNGEHVGTFKRTKCPISDDFTEEFFVSVPTDQADEAHSSLWL